MKLATTLAMLAALGAAACSPTAGMVEPSAAIPANTYQALSCQKAAETLAQARADVDSLSDRQNGAAAADTIGVLALGLPVGRMMGGNAKGDLAEAKAVKIAAETRMKGCGE